MTLAAQPQIIPGRLATSESSIAHGTSTAPAQLPACFIHIGFHRTGTSFLQTELFPLIPASALTQYIDEAERNGADRSLRLSILTNEYLSSDLKHDKPEMAQELAARFPGARILIGIRSQYSMMRGVYHLYVKGGGTDGYEDFVKVRCGRLFDYARTVDAYQAAFGRDNVMVLPLENLSRDLLGSLSALLRFVGADPHIAARVRNRRVKASAGDVTMMMLRARNRLIAPLRQRWPGLHAQILYRGLPGARLLDWILGRQIRLPAGRVRHVIRDAYADSNAKLFDAVGLNPENYDYPLSGR